MNDLVSFEFDDENVRVVMIADQPWFVANDVARVLGYNRAPDMVRKLHDDEKGVHILHTLGGEQTMTVISESGLYTCIFNSRKEEAQRFRRWVTGDVLPALRRHGRYEMPGATPPPALAALDSLNHDPTRLSASVATVRTAMRLFGMESARVIWMKLGLPTPIANARGGDNDELAGAIAAFLADKGETTIEEVGMGIGLTHIDGGARLRIGATLRLLGWHPRKVRRGQATVNLFTPMQTAMGESGEDA